MSSKREDPERPTWMGKSLRCDRLFEELRLRVEYLIEEAQALGLTESQCYPNPVQRKRLKGAKQRVTLQLKEIEKMLQEELRR